MKKIVFIIIIASVIILFLNPQTVDASEKKYILGFNIGMCKWPSEVFYYTRINAESSFRNNWKAMNLLEQEIGLKAIYNLSLQYNLSSSIGLLGEIGYQSGSYEADFALIPGISGLKIRYRNHCLSWRMTTFFLNAIIQMRNSERPIAPYAFIGLGICAFRGNAEQAKDYSIEIRPSQDLALKTGGGVNVYISRKFPFGVSLRAFVLVLGASLFSYYSPFEGSNVVFDIGGYQLIWGIELGSRYRF